MMIDDLFKVTRAFYERVKTSETSVTEIAARIGMTQPNFSSYLHGRQFGRGPREKIMQAGEIVGVAMPAVPAGFDAEDERIAEKFAALGAAMVWDWQFGRVYVGIDGDLATVPAFVKRFGDEGRRWVEMPPEAKRNFISPFEFKSKAGAR
jgi:hypothetical protein